jgi:triosephosphate isomerase
MKAVVTPPYFEVGIKNYIYGDAVIALAEEAEACAEESDVDVVFITPYTEIRRVADRTSRIIILAPYMDTLRPGRGLADILPEAVRDAGAHGVVLNHSERPMSIGAIEATIERATELDMLSFACANSVVEARAIAQFHPDIMNPEPSDLIGKPSAVDLEFMRASDKAVKSVYPDILVEQAAGITSPQQVYEYVLHGADGVGAASGIMLAPDPAATMRDMIRAVARARSDRSSSIQAGSEGEAS